MIILKVDGKEYNLKFGYKSFKSSGILKEVISMHSKIRSNDNDEDMRLEMFEEVFDLTSKLVLSALQKNHEEFRVEYRDEKSVSEIISKVDDLLDDYMDEEDSMSIMELFETLTEELFNNGFLSKKSKELEDSLTKQDATIVPQDHKMAEG